MKPITIALSPGHTPTAPGATRGNISEYSLSSAVIGDLIYRLSKRGHTAHLIGSNSNSHQVKRINKIAPDIGLELHFNNMSSQPDMNGTMCLHYPGSNQGVRLSSALTISLSRILNTINRGIWPAYYQLDPKNDVITIVRDTACPFVVVEPLYFSNDLDFEKIDIPALSIGLFDGIMEYWAGHVSEVG